MDTIFLISPVFILLLLISGFLAFTEGMMQAISSRRLQLLSNKGTDGAKQALFLFEHADSSLKALSFLRTFVNIIGALLAAGFFVNLSWAGNPAPAITALAVLLILLLLANSIPEAAGTVISPVYAEKFFLLTSRILVFQIRVIQPIIRLFDYTARYFLSALHLTHAPGKSLHPTSKKNSLVTQEPGGKHATPPDSQGIFHNLIEMEQVSVEDIMIPRSAIEAIDIELPFEEIIHRLGTTYHSRLPVYRNELNEILGIAQLRHLFSLLQSAELDKYSLENSLAEPYYVPAATPVLEQLHFFQESKNRLALVVDEYGEILGLVTLEDIIEEIIGEFATSQPGKTPRLAWEPENDSVLIEGSRALREINRKLNLNLPIDGPKTLNGLVLEHFRDIPEPGISIKIAGIPIEIVQTQGKSVKIARIFKPLP